MSNLLDQVAKSTVLLHTARRFTVRRSSTGQMPWPCRDTVNGEATRAAASDVRWLAFADLE
jgi:hypothetical protein